MLIQKFDYKPIPRTTAEGKRHYKLPDGSSVPSVTTILEATKPEEKKEALRNWRKRVGTTEAARITKEAANVGTVMHKKLEEYCLGTLQEPGSNLIQQQAHKMARVVIDHDQGLNLVNETWGVEVPLYYSGLYAGTTDWVGVWRDTPSIADFKQTNRPKKVEWIEDYFLQLAAYIAAHNEMFGSNIDRGVVLMCSRNLDFQHWVIEGRELARFTNKWWDRVELFYKNK